VAFKYQLVIIIEDEVEASFKGMRHNGSDRGFVNFWKLRFKESAFSGSRFTGKEEDFAFIKETFDVKVRKGKNKFILTVAETIYNLLVFAVVLQSVAERFKYQAIQVVHRFAKYDKKGFKEKLSV
jgi:hypothetical protein